MLCVNISANGRHLYELCVYLGVHGLVSASFSFLVFGFAYFVCHMERQEDMNAEDME